MADRVAVRRIGGVGDVDRHEHERAARGGELAEIADRPEYLHVRAFVGSVLAMRTVQRDWVLNAIHTQGLHARRHGILVPDDAVIKHRVGRRDHLGRPRCQTVFAGESIAVVCELIAELRAHIQRSLPAGPAPPAGEVVGPLRAREDIPADPKGRDILHRHVAGGDGDGRGVIGGVGVPDDDAAHRDVAAVRRERNAGSRAIPKVNALNNPPGVGREEKRTPDKLAVDETGTLVVAPATV